VSITGACAGFPWIRHPDQISGTLRTRHPGMARIEFLSNRAPRGLHRYLSDMAETISVFRHLVPCLLKVEL
jgi:hypothetical protein